MPFHAIPSKVRERAPTRAPRRTEAVPPASAPAPEDEDHEFPAVYDWSAALPSAKPRELAPALTSLIEVACSAMGCTPEQVQALRERALDASEDVKRFCRAVYESSEHAPRMDALTAARAEGSVAFWIEGLAGKAIARAPDTSLGAALRPYDGRTLALHEAARSPFPRYSPESFAAAKLLPRSQGRSARAHAPQAASGVEHDSSPLALPWEDDASPTAKASALDARSEPCPRSAAGMNEEEGRASLPAAQARPPCAAAVSDDDAWGLLDP